MLFEKNYVGVDALELQFNGVLAFNEEFVAATPKLLKNSVVMTQGAAVEIMIEDLLIMPGLNVRIKDAAYHAHVRYLADDMKVNGFRKNKPMTVFAAMERGKAVVYVADGEHRLAAIHLAISEGALIETATVVFEDKSTTMEDLTVSLVRSNDGRRLRPLEIAAACKRLVKFGWSDVRIAPALGLTVVYVNQLLVLAGAPSAIRDMVQDGILPAQVALDAMREHGGDAASVLTAAAAKAKAQGAKKVTKAGMVGRALPKKIVDGYIGSVDAFTKSLGKDVRKVLDSFTGIEPKGLAGQKVQVDAASLIALLASQKAANEFHSKQAAKAVKRAAKAALDMAAEVE